MITVLHVLAIVLGFWLFANVTHGLWIGWRRRLWERRLRRDADGLTEGSAAYTVGNGEIAILLVHGFADNPAVFAGMAELLARAGFTCRAMRLPGAADTLAVASRQTADTWLAAVRDEITELRGRHRTVWLVGHSKGGALAVLAHLNDPAIADGLVLLAPLIKVSPARAPLLSPRIWFHIAEIFFPLSPVFESAFSPQVLTRDGAAVRYVRDRFIPFATYRGLFALTGRLRRHGNRITVPLYAILAANDRVVDTAAAQRWLLERCPPALLQLEVLEQCGHAIPSEEQLLPRLCAAISDFIREKR